MTTQPQSRSDGRNGGSVVALCGGVGGAKLALGLDRILTADELTVVVNTGDDFEHLGLHVSPDLDTVTYTLAGCANPRTGWGRADETWHFMEALDQLGGETWFRLGDRDLALHIERTHRLAKGESLTQVTDAIRQRLKIRARLLPMSDDPVRTIVETPDGDLAFQHYFVKLACRPPVTGLRYQGADSAVPQAEVLQRLADPDLRALVICPSNPYLSIDPILALPGLRDAIAACPAPVVAVSPIVGGAAIKGPLAKIMGELGMPVTSAAIATHYGDLLDGLLIDRRDAAEGESLGLPCLVTDSLMRSLDDRMRLAHEVLAFADHLHRKTASHRATAKVAP